MCLFTHAPHAPLLYSWMWRSYMASQLSSLELVYFALLTFILADFNIKFKLVVGDHLAIYYRRGSASWAQLSSDSSVLL